MYFLIHFFEYFPFIYFYGNLFDWAFILALYIGSGLILLDKRIFPKSKIVIHFSIGIFYIIFMNLQGSVEAKENFWFGGLITYVKMISYLLNWFIILGVVYIIKFYIRKYNNQKLN